MRLFACLLLLPLPLLCQTAPSPENVAETAMTEGPFPPPSRPKSFLPAERLKEFMGFLNDRLPKERFQPLQPEPVGQVIADLQQRISKKVDAPSVEMPTSFLLPSKRERWALLANGASFTATQQPGTVLVQQADNSLRQQLNPDQWLYQATVTQNWSGLFWNSSDMLGAVKAFGDAAGGPSATHVIYGPCEDTIPHDRIAYLGQRPDQIVKLTGDAARSAHNSMEATGTSTVRSAKEVVLCLRQARKKDRAARTLSSFSGSLTYNRIAQILSNLPVPDQNRLNQFTGEAIFTPSKLFVSADDWKNTETVAEYYGDEYIGAVMRQVEDRCKGSNYRFSGTSSGQGGGLNSAGDITLCSRWIAASKGLGEHLLALVPAVDVKVQTQADFVKNGGILVQALYPQPVLLTMKATLDLTRFIPSAKDRATAYTMLNQLSVVARARAQREQLRTLRADLERVETQSDQKIESPMVDEVIAALKMLP